MLPLSFNPGVPKHACFLGNSCLDQLHDHLSLELRQSKGLWDSTVAWYPVQRKFSVQNFRVTDIQQLFNHHSSYTTHHTPLITHHSSYTTHHTPLIIHHSPHTTDHTPLIIHHSSYTTHHTPLIIHRSYTSSGFNSSSSRQLQLQVQIAWQVQHFVNLHVQISWQAQYKMRCGEIANARNAVFFNGTGGSEAGKSRFAERRVRDGLGSCSDHSRAWSESSLHWD